MGVYPNYTRWLEVLRAYETGLLSVVLIAATFAAILWASRSFGVRTRRLVDLLVLAVFWLSAALMVVTNL